jgi:hypothetical protein
MIRVSTINITRPADTTAYSVGDRVWTASGSTATGITAAGSVFSNLGETMFGNGFIVKAIMTTSAAVAGTPATGTYRLQLFTLSSGQTLATGAVVQDNSPLVFSFADSSKYVGFIDFSTWTTGAGYAYSVVTATTIAFQRGSIRNESDQTGYPGPTTGTLVNAGTLIGILETRTAIAAPNNGQQFFISLTANAAEGVSLSFK